ncbi:MAG: FecR domain-containing protein [Steroidobacteraceae bacterium]
MTTAGMSLCNIACRNSGPWAILRDGCRGCWDRPHICAGSGPTTMESGRKRGIPGMRLSTSRLATRAAAALRSLACAFFLSLPFTASATTGADDIVVVTVQGEVQIASGGRTTPARAGAALELPASLRTGRDGSADLRQGDTTIGVGPETRLEFPAPAASERALERVVQPAGNAFYDVGPQGNRRLRVETPLLVAVIKGTQFNVAVGPDSSTISLFEGRLEVLATESGIASVELNAGEVAVRRSGEKTIRVLKLRNGGASPGAPAGGGDNDDDGDDGDEAADGVAASDGNDQGSGLPDDALPLDDDVDDAFGQGVPGLPTNPIDGGIAIDLDGGIDGLAGAPIGVEAGIGADLDLGAGDVGANVNAGIDLGATSADIGIDAGLDLGAGTVEAGLDAGVDLGAASVDTSVGAEVDLGAGTVDAGLDAGVDLGAANIDTSVGAGADLGAGTVDAGVDVGVDLGADVGADVGAGAAVDAGAGTIDAGVDADVAGADVGVDVGVDLGGSDAGIDVGVGLPGVDIDLGLGGGAQGSEAAGAPDADDSGGLLGGILRRNRN